MEEKKSLRANLDAKRLQGFLFGLVVALACLYAALEFSIEPDDPLDDPELLDRLSTDAELSAFMKPEKEILLAPKQEQQPTTKIKVADETPIEEILQELVETDLEENMERLDEEQEPPQPLTEEEQQQFRVLQDLPQFPGGLQEFAKWLTQHLKYPKELEDSKVQGKVIAEFMVNTDGSITDVKIVQALNTLCDIEVLRVLRLMPRWTPGIENGQPCRTKVCVPVLFRQ